MLGAKLIGAGAATIALAGAAVGIGNVFSSCAVLRRMLSVIREKNVYSASRCSSKAPSPSVPVNGKV